MSPAAASPNAPHRLRVAVASALTLGVHGLLTWRMTERLFADGPPSLPGHARLLWQVSLLVDRLRPSPVDSALVGEASPGPMDTLSGALPLFLAQTARLTTLDESVVLAGALASLHWVLLPLLCFASARLLKIGFGAALIALTLWSLIWYTDSAFRWAWQLNAAGYAFAAPWAVLGAAALYRQLDQKPSLVSLAAAAVSGLVVGLLSPAVFWGLPIWGALACFSGGRARGARIGLSLLPGLIAAAWVSALSESPVAAPPTSTSISTLLLDLLDLTDAEAAAAGATRTAFRTVALAVGGFQLWTWRKLRDGREKPLAVLAAYGALLTYSPMPIDAFEGPLLAATLAVALAASVSLADSFSPAARAAWSSDARVVLLLAALLAAPRAFAAIAYRAPELLPDRTLRFPNDPFQSPLVSLNEPLPGTPRVVAPDEIETAVRWITANAPTGSVATDDPALAFALARNGTPSLIVCDAGARWCPRSAVSGSHELGSTNSGLFAARFIDGSARPHSEVLWQTLGWTVLRVAGAPR